MVSRRASCSLTLVALALILASSAQDVRGQALPQKTSPLAPADSTTNRLHFAEVASGENQYTVAGKRLQNPFRVRVLRNGIPVQGCAVHFSIVATPGPDTQASLDSSLVYTNAGHNAGLLVRADGSTQRLDGNGLPLGLFPVAEYDRAEVTLAPGDLVVLYTDGITEAANEAGEEFGLERLEKVVKEQAREPLVALAVAIETAVEVFAEERRFADDRTLVILRREPESA